MKRLMVIGFLSLITSRPLLADPGNWVDRSLGCDSLIDNVCLRAVHNAPHDYAERRRRYEARRQEQRLINQGRYREDWRAREISRIERERREAREERREDYRDERRSDRLSELDNSPRCRDMRRMPGAPHITENGARKAAERAWQDLVRFDMGEKFSDFSYAEDPRFTCIKTPTTESVLSKAAEDVGVGYHKCTVVARPCRPRAAPIEK